MTLILASEDVFADTNCNAWMHTGIILDNGAGLVCKMISI